MHLIFIVLLMIASTHVKAHAQEKEGVMNPENSALCRLLDKQSAVKGAIYQPRVDEKGKPVMPADVAGVSTFGMPDVITIPLDVSLQNRLRALKEFGFDADTNLGVAEIYSDGKVSVNGQDVSSQTGILCAKSQRIVTDVKEVPATKVEPSPVPETPSAEVIEREPLDSMTSYAAESGLLEKVMAEPEPKPQMTKEEIAQELKSIVTDLNDLENNNGLIQGSDFRE